MSRLGNLSTLRIGFTQDWKSNWYEPVSPNILLFQDFKIRDYLSGIFYKLKAPTSYYHVSWLSSTMLLIRWEVYWNVSFRLNNFLFRNYWFGNNNGWKILYRQDTYLKLLSSLVYLEQKIKIKTSASTIKRWLWLNAYGNWMSDLCMQELVWIMSYLSVGVSLRKCPSYISHWKQVPLYIHKFVLTRGEILQWNMMSVFQLVEKSISRYTQQNVFCFVKSYMWRKPPITNAKMIADYVMYTLERGMNFRKIFFKLKKWQKKNYYRGRIKHGRRRLHMWKYDAAKRTSCLGIKIECVGTSKKGRMAKQTAYADWIRDPRYSHRMPNNTFNADIDYYQTYAVKRSSTVGVKVWVFLKSTIQNQARRYVSLLV